MLSITGTDTQIVCPEDPKVTLTIKSPWIKCIERLPENYEDIFFVDCDKKIYIGFFKETFYAYNLLYHIEEVTHWAPLSALPLPEGK